MSQSNKEYKYKYMRRWYEFLRTLEMGGGTLIILLFLIVLFLTLSAFHVAEAGRFLDMFVGALLLHLKSSLTHPEIKKESEINNNDETKPKVL